MHSLLSQWPSHGFEVVPECFPYCLPQYVALYRIVPNRLGAHLVRMCSLHQSFADSRCYKHIEAVSKHYEEVDHANTAPGLRLSCSTGKPWIAFFAVALLTALDSCAE